MLDERTETHSWPELAIGLYDKLTGRNAEITYAFNDVKLGVPSGTGDGAKLARWTIDGTVRISTRDHGSDGS